METLRAFLAVGGGGGAAGGVGGEGDGAVGGATFLLSSKRYRSTKPRSASYMWSRNGVWKVCLIFVLSVLGRTSRASM